MLQSIHFKREYRMFEKGAEFHFLPDTPNLLVGDQGTGKSTLLEILGSPERFQKYVTIDSTPIDVVMLSAEFDNPRTKEAAETPSRRLEAGIDTQGQWAAKQLEGLKDEQGVLWLLDDPDTGLSVRNCYRLLELMNMAVAQGCQVVAAVHSPILIRGFRQVLSLEHRKWVYPTDFIEHHTPTSVTRISGRLHSPGT